MKIRHELTRSWSLVKVFKKKFAVVGTKSPISGCRFENLALGYIGEERRSSRGAGGAEWLRGRLEGSAMTGFWP
jgi:hypothetical protein